MMILDQAWIYPLKTLEQAKQNFLFHCQYEKNLTGKTLNAYSIDLRQFQEFLEERGFLAGIVDVGKQELRDYLKFISGITKPKTVKRKFATLKAFFSFLEWEDIIVVSPFRKMRINIALDNHLPVVMTLSEVRTLLGYLYQRQRSIGPMLKPRQRLLIRDIAIIEMLFATGMRVTELVHLKCSDVDLADGTVRIFGKGRKERILPLCNKKVLHCLARYREMVNDASNSIYFFLNQSGQNLTEQAVRIIVAKHTHKAGLEKKITPHTFRHTVATLLLENGMGIRNIQKLLGHSNITTTEIYAKVNQEAQRALIGKYHPRELIKHT